MAEETLQIKLLPEAAELRGHGLCLLARCTEKLGKLARDPEPNMAISAVQALGKIGSPTTIEALFHLMPNERVAEEAVLALARIDDDTLGPRLLASLDKAVPSLAASIAGVLWRYAAGGALEALLPMARSPFKPVRRSAVESLGRLADARAAPTLLELLDDAEEDVVIVTLKALEKIRPQEPGTLLTLLTERFDRTPSAKARATLVQIFQGTSGEDVLALMKKALKDENARVRANAVEVVHGMELPEKRKLGILKPLVTEGQNNRVMGNLAIALGEIDPKASMQILSTLLNSTEKWERASAVYAARHIKSERISGWLTTIFTTEADPDVLRNVIESLSFFSGDEVTACFVKALTHANPLVRSGAVQSLGRISDPAVEGSLLKLLDREEDRNVICEALTTLGKISEPSRIGVVSRYLQHTDLRVQANAIDALMHIGSIEIIPHVEPFLNSSDNRVKANAAVSLWRSGNLLVVDELEGMLDGPNIKQRSSAIYAVGEVGESLRDLRNLQKYLLLVSALQEDLQIRRREESATEVSGLHKMSASAPRPKADRPPAPFPIQELEKAMALVASGKPEAALELLAGDATANPYLGFLRADLHRRRGELAPAIESFTRSNDASGPFVHPHLHLANLYNRTQDIPRSLQEYFAAMAAQLEVIAEQIDLGQRLLAEDRVNDASLLLKSLASQVPINPKMHHVAGNEFLRHKSYEEAFQHLTRAFLTEAPSSELLFGLAIACFKTGRISETRALCQKLEAQFGAEPDIQRKAAELMKLVDRSGGERG